MFATTTGYQVRAFDEAAADLGSSCSWRPTAAISSTTHGAIGRWRCVSRTGAGGGRLVACAEPQPLDGVLAVGDRPATLAAAVAEALRLPWHSHAAAQASRSKLRTRQRLREAGLPVPEFGVIASEQDLAAWSDRGPVVVKPVALSGSRGVIRADTPDRASPRLGARRAGCSPSPTSARCAIPRPTSSWSRRSSRGASTPSKGVLSHGRLQVLAIFDKPDPLYGPYFEETLYVTPSRASSQVQRAIEAAVAAACRALGLSHGPIHAECRVNDRGVFILEVAARPIGGICARALRFTGTAGATATLEGLLLRHAIGERVDGWTLESGASGVMMIPIPGPGVLRGVDGADRARAVPGIDDVVADREARSDAGAAAGRRDVSGVHLRARRDAGRGGIGAAHGARGLR